MHAPPIVLQFAELEKTLGETARTRSIYELAIAQPVLDMPESLWKAGAGVKRIQEQDLAGRTVQVSCRSNLDGRGIALIVPKPGDGMYALLCPVSIFALLATTFVPVHVLGSLFWEWTVLSCCPGVQ